MASYKVIGKLKTGKMCLEITASDFIYNFLNYRLRVLLKKFKKAYLS